MNRSVITSHRRKNKIRLGDTVFDVVLTLLLLVFCVVIL